jgi:hypothetical protein
MIAFLLDVDRIKPDIRAVDGWNTLLSLFPDTAMMLFFFVGVGIASGHLPPKQLVCKYKKPSKLWTLTSMFSKFRSLLSLLIAVLATECIPTASALADGDDFSNNLFTDLGPIISLFGEQVAKQFMAGSLGWSDNILFAMVSHTSSVYTGLLDCTSLTSKYSCL